MEVAAKIRDSIAEVNELRRQRLESPRLQIAIMAVKQFQANRFRHTYRDLLASGQYANALAFFLDELYGERDFSVRDAQFARIAAALERLLPPAILDTVVALAELHHLTEELDQEMAAAAVDTMTGSSLSVEQYRNAWRIVGQRDQRARQLELVLALGTDLARHIRFPGLGLLLRAMQAPARAAGLGAIQAFLRNGFEAFAILERHDMGAQQLLAHIRSRESQVIELLFNGPLATSLAQLSVGRTDLDSG